MSLCQLCLRKLPRKTCVRCAGCPPGAGPQGATQAPCQSSSSLDSRSMNRDNPTQATDPPPHSLLLLQPHLRIKIKPDLLPAVKTAFIFPTPEPSDFTRSSAEGLRAGSSPHHILPTRLTQLQSTAKSPGPATGHAPRHQGFPSGHICRHGVRWSAPGGV